jgi:hypothetical protein
MVFQAELDRLRVREKVHTPEGDAIAAACPRSAHRDYENECHDHMIEARSPPDELWTAS